MIIISHFFMMFVVMVIVDWNLFIYRPNGFQIKMNITYWLKTSLENFRLFPVDMYTIITDTYPYS